MAQDFDVSIKLLFRQSKGLAMTRLAGGGVQEWLNVELPEVRNPRVDLVGRLANGELVHIEIESSQKSDTGQRGAEYHLGLLRTLKQEAEPIILYVGPEPLRMSPIFRTKHMTFEFRLVDVRDLPGEELIASDDLSDNILAVLTRADRDRVIDRVLQRISELGGDARRSAIEVFVIISGLRDLEEVVLERIQRYMPIVDIMENKVFGPRIRQGIEQGRQEGRQEGESTILEALLRKRFRTIPEWATLRLRTASEAELLAWAESVLSAQTLDDVFRS